MGLHTGTSWELESHDGYYTVLGDRVVARVLSLPDATLIVAAPKLFMALRRLLFDLDWTTAEGELANAIKEAQGALNVVYGSDQFGIES